MKRTPDKLAWKRWGLGLWFGAVCALSLCGWGLLAGGLPQAGAGETAIPNDVFAVQAPADADDAAEAMMLKIACLTFDDGPSPNTRPILDILADRDVPATFFVVAQEVNRDYLPLLADIQAEGHQVALHSATHKYSQIYAGSEAFWLDIKALRQAISPYVDVENIHWLRFPGGSTNTVSHKYGGSGIMQQLIREAEEKGYEWIDWNVSAEDAAGGDPDADQILANIRRDAEGRDLCVVLMHDTAKTDATVEALPSLTGSAARDTISVPWNRCTRPGTAADRMQLSDDGFLHPAQPGGAKFWQAYKTGHGVEMTVPFSLHCRARRGIIKLLAAPKAGPISGVCRPLAGHRQRAGKRGKLCTAPKLPASRCAVCWGR